MEIDHKKALLTVLVLALVLLGVYAFTEGRVNAPAKIDNTSTLTQEPAQTSATTSPVVYEGVEGKSAMELLKESHEVETKQFSGVGEFVTAIDGIEAGSSHFWSFYVNGEMSQVGASDYVTKDGDEIEWKLEEIK